MNIGIRLHDTKPGTLKERLAFAKAQGFTCAHVALSKVLDDFAMEDAPGKLTDEYAAAVRKDFDESGLECAVLGCYLNLTDLNPERRARTQEIYKAHLRFAPKIGARVVGSETFANPEMKLTEPAGQSEEAFRLFMDSLRPIVRCAEENGAVMAIEPVWNHVIATPERAARMLEEMPSDNLQIILDAVNLIAPENAGRADEIIRNAVSLLGDRVRILHMKDFVLTQEGKMDACACGTGSMRYDRLLAFGKAKDIPMTLENTVPDNAEAARLYLEKAAEAL